jgi:hypothetical protein
MDSYAECLRLPCLSLEVEVTQTREIGRQQRARKESIADREN